MDIEKLIEQLNGYFEGNDLKRVNCTPKVGQESQRKGCRNLWEKNCSVRN